MTGATHQTAISLIALNAEGGAAPEWVELIPAGPDVVGRDGRRWTMPDPQAVIDATDLAQNPVAIDWEHAGMVRPQQGLDAPAAAWIDELEARNGAVWGRVSWTPRAADQVGAREYRFLSPVFTFDGATGRIKRLVSAALTNNPNLHLTALNRAVLNREPEDTLDLALLRSALGLAADASDDAILAAAREIRAANSRGADLTNYAPRAELTAAVNRANELQTQLDTRAAADREAAITAAVDGAIKEGKVAPVSRETYLAMCRAEGGLESFNALVATLPVLASSQRVTPSQPEAANAKGGKLSADHMALCKRMGWDPDEFAKGLAEEGY